MSYYKALGLAGEPFSNSPNPEFFYRVHGRIEILNLLEISIRLRRGLNIVLGEVGTGKTTLCRQFLRVIMEDDAFEPLLLLDPYFSSPHEFLRVLYNMLLHEKPEESVSEWQLKEEVKSALLKHGAEQRKVVVLIIDEGQKIQDDCLELLRELLNFETNQNKLLQIVIFAQNEFKESMARFPNLLDRVDSLHSLDSLGFIEMREMIRYRLDLVKTGEKAPELFSTGAYWAVYKLTKGFPRKVVTLCHKTLLETIMAGKTQATSSLVHAAAGKKTHLKRFSLGAAACAASVALALAFWPGSSSIELQSETDNSPSITTPQQNPAPVLESAGSPDPASPTSNQGAASFDVPAKARQHVSVPSADIKGGDIASNGVELLVSEASQLGNSTSLAIETSSEPISLADTPRRSEMKIGERAPLPEGTPILGSIPLRKGELLSRIISRVYGIYHKDYLAKVLAANPQIDDPDRVNAGVRIVFPAVAEVEASQLPQGYALRLAEYDSLEAAVDALRDPVFEYHAVRIASVSKGNDAPIRFLLLSQRRFPTEAEAHRVLSSYPEAVRKKVLVLRHWHPETVFHNEEAMWGVDVALR